MKNTIMSSMNYCLILAGGIGQRLWPVSRSSKPKQFLDLSGTGRTMLQQTYDRVSRFIDTNNIYISTNVRISLWSTNSCLRWMICIYWKSLSDVVLWLL